MHRSSSTTLNRALTDYIRRGQTHHARQLFDESPHSRDTVSWNTMISAYARQHQLHPAQHLFDQMPRRDVVSWNAIISAHHRLNHPDKVMDHFLQMTRLGVTPTEFTMATVISSSSTSNTLTLTSTLTPQLHACAISSGLSLSVFVGSALIRSYECLKCEASMRRTFDEIVVKDVTSWNALVSGYMNLGLVEKARETFATMSEKNVVSWTSLVSGLINNQKLNEARRSFDMMPEKNTVSWTVVISGYERNGLFVEALELFVEALEMRVQPNQFTLSSVVSACAGCSSIVFGRQVHGNILKSGTPVDVVLASSLVDMYAKCGDIDAAVGVFEAIAVKNLEAWNSIIGGYARHGDGRKALDELDRMKRYGLKPDQITFVNVLSACAHGGLVEEGELHFGSMERVYGIQPEKEHFACMVDLFGRAGQLEKAEKLIKGMPFEPDVVVWGALLGACELHSSLEFGLFAAEAMYKLEKDHPAMYALLSKIHGDRGVWSRVSELRSMMKQSGAKKQMAGSWVESSFHVN